MQDLRDFIRDNKLIERQEIRESLLNRNRNVESTSELQVTKETLIEQATMLRVRSKVTPQLLTSLQHVLLQSCDNCVLFIQVQGALQGLVTALSGQNSKLQLLSAYCLCNLALSNEKISCQVIKAAGSYLNVHLKGMNSYLMEACAWTIGNLTSHGPKCVTMVEALGTSSELTHVLRTSEDNVVQTSVLYALTQIVFHGFAVLKDEDLCAILPAALQVYPAQPTSAFLLALLSSHPSCHGTMLQHSLQVEAAKGLTQGKHETAHIRIIANLVSEPTGQAALQVLIVLGETTQQQYLQDMPSQCLKEFLWLVGNLVNHPQQNVSCAGEQFALQLVNVIPNLQIQNLISAPVPTM